MNYRWAWFALAVVVLVWWAHATRYHVTSGAGLVVVQDRWRNRGCVLASGKTACFDLSHPSVNPF